jgi:hypothetical protein
MKSTQGICLCKGVMSAGLCLGIAGFAVYSMASARTFFAPEGNPVQMQASHDPLQNGMRIMETRRESTPRLTRPDHDDATVILLDDWSYTGKTKPSPYN